MALKTGTRLGPYEITAPIGAGGMGEVYRATDTKLKREVAIKVLPENVAGDSERLARFEREARLLASLSHPHIASIYGLEESDGVPCLVLELLEGETLAERLEAGALPVDEALAVAVQIASGLEAAHEKGIIHRDLKPANVKITPEGTVKVLDFGLAKALVDEPAKGSADVSLSPTLTMAATQAGVILGTAAYMSPEQARGQAVDQRADVWAFGCVLYELLAGTKPFAGDTLTDILAAIVRAEPDWGALAARVSTELVGITKRCLRKNPRERLHGMGDIGLTLKQLAQEGAAPKPASGTAAAPPDAARRGVSRTFIAGSLLVVAVVAMGLGTWLSRSEPAAEPQRRFSIQLQEGTFLPAGVGTALAISEDGSTVVYLADDLDARRLYVRRINEFEARVLPGTDGANEPFFSPDAEWVGFNQGGGLGKISLSTLEVHRLCDSCGWGTWGDDGNVLFTRGNDLWRVSETGGQEELVAAARPAEGIPALIRADVLPGSRVVLFEFGTVRFGGVGALSLKSGEILRISADGSDPFYSATGHVIFPRKNTLFAVPFDKERFEVTGRETHVLQGVRVENAGALQAATSSNGLLIYAPSGETMGTQLTWVDGQGGREAVNDLWRSYRGPRISPTGDRIATVINDSGRTDIWVVDVDSGGMVPLTTTGAASAPVWTPDGARVTFAEADADRYWIRSVAADGSGSEEMLLQSDYPIEPETWHPDGKILVYRAERESADMFLLDVSTSTTTPLLDGDAREDGGALSPDGGRLAYVSDKTGVVEVYLRPFPGPGPEVPVSIGGGRGAIWSRDGSEIFYRDERLFTAASIEGLRVTGRQAVFRAIFFWSDWVSSDADVHPDGQRFVVLHKNEDQIRPGINVVVNWFDELKRRASTGR